MKGGRGWEGGERLMEVGKWQMKVHEGGAGGS